MNSTELAARLKQIRINARYNVQRMARELDCSVRYIEQIEAGDLDIPLTLAVEWADLCGMDIDVQFKAKD